MSGRRVAVLGAGLAGVAAACAARRAGARVVVFTDAPGASTMASGALSGELDEDARAFFEVLGGARFGDGPAVVATQAGALRTARGVDESLLDLTKLVGQTVGVAVTPRLGWDGRAITATLEDQPRARELAISFVPVEVELLRELDEARYPAVDFARLVEDGERLAWTAARIREALLRSGATALLTGPWLGATAPIARQLSEAAGAPVGEVTSLPGEAAGRRLASALARALGDAPRRGAVTVGPDLTVAGERFDAVVLATGGVVGGGISFRRTDPTVVGGAPAHLVATALPEALVAWNDDSAAEVGAALPSLAWRDDAVLPRAGIVTHDLSVMTSSRAPIAGLYACGDLRCGEGTMLGAASSGWRAGRLAAG